MLPPPSSPFEAPPGLAERVAWSGEAVAPPLELSRARFKELRAIGHKVERFLNARVRWWRQSKEPGPSALRDWVRSLTDQAPGELSGEGVFACRLMLTASGFRIVSTVLPVELTARLAALWRKAEPDLPRELPAWLKIPADADAPLWLALFRLRPLRDYWDRELRRATVESLLQLLPDAWVLHPTPVPEGAVIPRLELAHWQELPRWRTAGRSFLLVRSHSAASGTVLHPGLPLQAWQEAVAQALRDFEREPCVLVEHLDVTGVGAPVIVSFYESRAGRVDGLGALALVPQPDGRLLPARVREA